ncbi:MAG: DUF4959 domain-containing protein [Prevotellaceae bacterium]|jgi:hypothetical protein|nr:DUF4959 domain-containing protein [Prevotellaceae bacterium]
MKNFSTFNFQLLTVLLLATLIIFNGCTEEPIGQQPEDSVAPGKVTPLLPTKSVPGGAVVYYQFPADEDLLYVKAVYTLQDGKERDVKASVYTDSLEILGFGDTESRTIQLIAVDRSRNESTPVPVTIQPGTPPVLAIGESLDLVADFGGLHAYWDNSLKAKISIPVLVKDHNGDYVPVETFYSEQVQGEGTVRGMDTIEVDVKIYVQDRWGNQSQPKTYTLTPIYETLFDRLKFSIVSLSNDAAAYSANYALEKMFNGDKNGEQSLATQGTSQGGAAWPQSVTIDLGLVGKLSRIRLYQRISTPPGYLFREGNLHLFELYGRSDTPSMNGDWSEWTLLAQCESKKPSGLPLGQTNDEDLAVGQNGEDFPIPVAAAPLRYLRIKVLETWADGDNFQIGEIEVYGDNR